MPLLFFVIGASLLQRLYSSKTSPAVAVLSAVISVESVFLILGLAMLGRKTWARFAYLFLAPTNLAINLIFGTFRLGVVNILDRIPSLVVTTVFMVALLRSSAKAWFLGHSPAPAIATTVKGVEPARVKPISIVCAAVACLIAMLWLANHFVRVGGPGDKTGHGIIEH